MSSTHEYGIIAAALAVGLFEIIYRKDLGSFNLI